MKRQSKNVKASRKTTTRKSSKKGEVRNAVNAQYVPSALQIKGLSGTVVNETSALNISTVFACIRTIAQTIGTLPAHIIRKTPNGKERVGDHPLNSILNECVTPDIPPYMSAFSFRETLQAHALSWGGGFAFIQRERNTLQPVGLWVRRPDRVTIKEDDDGTIYYQWKDGHLTHRIEAADMLHVYGLGFDGKQGYGVIRMASESIGHAAALEKFGSAFFGNSALPAGFLKTDSQLEPEARENLRASWNSAFQGPDKAHRIAVLEEGMSWESMGIPPEQAQFLQTRKFSVQEIARWFGVPTFMVGDYERMTYSNISQADLHYYKQTVLAWIRRWESQLTFKLFRLIGDTEHYIEFKTEELLRADIETRYRAYAIGVNWGWLTRNEVRGYENLNPIDGLDEPLQPVNMSTPDILNTPASQQAPSSGNGVTEMKALKPATEDSTVNIADVFAIVLQEAISRCLRMEQKAIGSKVKAFKNDNGKEEFAEFVKAYYSDQRSKIDDIIGFAYRSYLKASKQDDERSVAVIVDDHISRSRGRLLGMLKNEGDCWTEIGESLRSWEQRAEQQASEIIHGGKDGERIS